MNVFRQFYHGFRVIQDSNLVDEVEDWSRVRSPGRARRRRAKHRQNITVRLVPKQQVFVTRDTVIVHPETLKEVERRLAQQMLRMSDEQFRLALAYGLGAQKDGHFVDINQP